MSQYSHRHDHASQKSCQSHFTSGVTSSPEPIASTSHDDVSSVDQVESGTPGKNQKRQTTSEYKGGTHPEKRQCEPDDVNQRGHAHASCSIAREQSSSGEDNINGVTSSLERTSFGAENTYKSSEGTLKNTLHGIIYQLKLLMLFVNRGLGKGYGFCLATEMNVADKFDDVVFRYRTAKREIIVCRYLQAKHKQDESERISISDLLNDMKGDFSLQKYFVSYRKIMNDPGLRKFPLQDCVICTNIDFDVSNKKKPKKSHLRFKFTDDPPQLSEICLKKIDEPDNFLDIKSSKQSARYQLSAHPKSEVFQILRNSENRGCVTDEDIKEFLKKLVFAVNQPNEVQLDATIAQEIGEHCNLNLLQADIVSDSFLKRMLDWLKAKGKEKGREGEFFTSEEGRAFFASMNDKIYTLVCSGMSSAYREELESYGLKFLDDPKWTTFLDDEDEQMLHLIADVETLPTAIRVCEAIENRPKYAKDYGLILMQLRTFLPERTKKLVIDFFKSLGKYDLLVIDCESPNDEDSKRLLEVYWTALRKIIDENSAKKIILIHTKRSGEFWFSNTRETFDTSSFIDLTKESKQRLLENPIISFQGRQDKVDFKNLLGDRAFDYIVSKRSTNFGNAVDASTLVKLIRGDEIEVGTGSHALRNEAEFYVSRDVNRQLLTKDVFTSQLKHDVFAIGNIDRETLQRLVVNDDRIQSTAELDKNELQPGKFFIFDGMEESRMKIEFENLCDRRPEGLNVHWIEYEKGAVIWKQSKGNIQNLMKYRAVKNRNYNTIPGECRITDRDLMDVHGKIIIISDPLGMGKTTLFSQLAGKMIEDESLLWVITINLNDFVNVLEKRKEDEKQAIHHDAIEFVIKNLSGLETALEMEILRTSMKRDSGVVLLFDGFDEISPKYSGTVVNLLRGMKDASGVKKLFVSTRPEMRELLEEELGSFSYTMEPFSVPIQEKFLTKFWEHKFKLDETFADCPTDGTRLKTYAEALVKRVAESINDQENQLAGIPLHLRMLAEIFQCGTIDQNDNIQTCKTFLKSKNAVPKLTKKMNVVYLYDRYCSKVYRRHCDQKDKQSSTLSAQINSEKLFKSLMRSHRRLAVYALFDTADYDGTPQNEIDEYIAEVRNGEERVGIITGIVDNRPGFIHRSFAEYFVAKFLVEDLLPNSNDQNEKTKKFVGSILLEPRHNVIRAFLNGLLLLNMDNQMSVNQSSTSAIVKARGKNGETVLHVVCHERHTGILKFVLNPDVDHEILRKLIDTTALDREMKSDKYGSDCEYSSTALCHAAYRGYLEGMKLILEYDKECLSRLADDESFPESVLPLYGAILGRHDKVVEWLLKNGADPNIGRPCGDLPDTPLYLAVSGRNFELDPRGLMVVKYLVKSDADPFAEVQIPKLETNVKDADDSYFQMLQEMIRNYKIGSAGWSSALDVAAATSGAEVNAAMCFFLEGDKFSEKEVETKKTLLCNAIWHATKNIFPMNMVYLMDKLKAVDVDTVFHDRYSRNLLRYLVAQPHVERLGVIVLIQRTNVDFTAADEHGPTVLSWLLSNTDTEGAWEVVCWLIGNERVRLADQADGGMKLVHKIIDEFRYAIGSVDGLFHVEHQAWKILKVSAKSSPVGTNHETDRIFDNKILKFAFENASLEDIQWLVETYKNIDTTKKVEEENTEMYSCLRYALSIGRFDVVRWLAYKDGVDLESRDPKSGKTIQHAAAQAGYVDLLEWLLERGAAEPETQKTRLDVLDNDKNTLLHASCTTVDNLEMMKFLLKKFHERKLDVNARNKYGQTPLHLCCKYVDLEYAKCLSEQPDVNVNSQDTNGCTPLHYSCLRANGMIEHVRLSKEDLVKAPDEGGLTPFHYSSGAHRRSNSRKAYFRSCRCSSPEGPISDASNNDGLTPSNCRCEFCDNFEIVKLLLSKKALISATDRSNLTPLHCSCGCHKWRKTYSMPNLDFLRSPIFDMPIAGAPHKPSHRRCEVCNWYDTVTLILPESDKYRSQAIYSCKLIINLKIVKLLVSRNADYKARTNLDHTLLHIASKNDQLELELANYLVKFLQLDISAVDKNGKMAWEYRECKQCDRCPTPQCDICLLFKPQHM